MGGQDQGEGTTLGLEAKFLDEASRSSWCVTPDLLSHPPFFPLSSSYPARFLFVSSTPSWVLPQDLCIGCSLSLECPSSASLHV